MCVCITHIRLREQEQNRDVDNEDGNKNKLCAQRLINYLQKMSLFFHRSSMNSHMKVFFFLSPLVEKCTTVEMKLLYII